MAITQMPSTRRRPASSMSSPPARSAPASGTTREGVCRDPGPAGPRSGCRRPPHRTGGGGDPGRPGSERRHHHTSTDPLVSTVDADAAAAARAHERRPSTAASAAPRSPSTRRPSAASSISGGPDADRPVVDREALRAWPAITRRSGRGCQDAGFTWGAKGVAEVTPGVEGRSSTSTQHAGGAGALATRARGARRGRRAGYDRHPAGADNGGGSGRGGQKDPPLDVDHLLRAGDRQLLGREHQHPGQGP